MPTDLLGRDGFGLGQRSPGLGSAYRAHANTFGEAEVLPPVNAPQAEYCRTAVTTAFLSHGQGVIRWPVEPFVTAAELYWRPGLAGCLLHRHAYY
jgi:hypothetical protein